MNKAWQSPMRNERRRDSCEQIATAQGVEVPSGPSGVAERVISSHFISLRVLCVQWFINQAADKDLVSAETKRLG